MVLLNNSEDVFECMAVGLTLNPCYQFAEPLFGPWRELLCLLRRLSAMRENVNIPFNLCYGLIISNEWKLDFRIRFVCRTQCIQDIASRCARCSRATTMPFRRTMYPYAAILVSSSTLQVLHSTEPYVGRYAVVPFNRLRSISSYVSPETCSWISEIDLSAWSAFRC